MAEEPSSTDRDGCESGAAVETTNEVKLSPKRCSSSSAPDGVPPQKSPRIEMLLTSTRTLDAGEEHPDMDRLEMASGSTAEPETCSPVNRTARRKSWRRATMTRRSLSALPNPHQIEKMKKKCSSVGKCISSEQQSQRTAEPAVQKAMVIQNTINRIQAESQSWEALSHKHRSKAEDLERKLADGQKKAISFDHTCMAQSSQYQLIRSKPDYHALLRRQQSMLHTMTLVTDIQYKLARELQSIKEVSQSMVKEISGRLAAQAGFQDHSPNIIKDLIVALTTSASTVTLNGAKASI
ncbi:kinetochore-associated protein DSN1 homolog isoform X3 [Phyllopteryx taeniolatus]|uniref:kinetochore-associated protein DSN1 homolog isoform X3 n=1 Tax=Phyllopteryx taeniolatus TaxID=161469 RepID=UPI002AD2A11F|nr:kinetochore-associated protein DSN1 homolog isoform X3 [Phyllopteryx taeniolatus]